MVLVPSVFWRCCLGGSKGTGPDHGPSGPWGMKVTAGPSGPGPLWGKHFRRPQIFSLEISGPKVVLLCKFSLYRAVRAPIGARALRLQPHQPHGWSGPVSCESCWVQRWLSLCADQFITLVSVCWCVCRLWPSIARLACSHWSRK